MVVILNDRREVVFANRYLQNLLQLESLDQVYGRPPGELLDCPHAFEDGGGCGFTEACESCGAHRTIRACGRGEHSIQECRILQRTSGHALDLRVSGTPVRFGDEGFTILTLTDISHEKRRQALERVFFHDLMNLATGIVAYSAVVKRATQPDSVRDAAQSISKLVRQLAEEIRAQRELIEAEADELEPRCEPIAIREALDRVIETYRGHQVAQQRSLVLDPQAADAEFTSDQNLLSRVLGNLVKNALEAAGPGEQVTVGCTAEDHEVRFQVHNPGHMPRDVQLQIFQRSFSTKGAGRGLGTYSVKLLTERYLKGRVWFTSTAADGTTFYVSYPKKL